MTTITPFNQFIQSKHGEARRAAPHADVRLVPEAEGYAVYADKPRPAVPLAETNALIRTLTSTGHSVALLDKVSRGAHGGWRLVEIATIPATGAKAAETSTEDEDFA